MENYSVNDSNDDIILEVRAGTVGICETRVYIRIEGSFVKIITSEEINNGNIPPSNIEINKNLINSFVLIRSVLNFSNVEEGEARKKAIETTLLNYILNGGPEGEKKFKAQGMDILIISETKVVITKLIKFLWDVNGML